MFNNFFPKIAPFMRQCLKTCWSQRGHNWRHNMAHTRCMLDKQCYEHTRSHIQLCNTYCFSTVRIVSLRTSVLPYTYIACLVEFLLTVEENDENKSAQFCNAAEWEDESEGVKWLVLCGRDGWCINPRQDHKLRFFEKVLWEHTETCEEVTRQNCVVSISYKMLFGEKIKENVTDGAYRTNARWRALRKFFVGNR
jgi:hypothetical protein